MPPFGPYVGESMFQVTIYADVSGEEVRFTFFTGSTTAALAETLVFSINGNVGSVVSPFLLTGV
jgi:hypothetical protein